LFANPYQPDVCPILALGLHLLYFSVSETYDLFPGGAIGTRGNRQTKTRSQIIRFYNCLISTMRESVIMKETLRICGLAADMIGKEIIKAYNSNNCYFYILMYLGTHSFRKGCATLIGAVNSGGSHVLALFDRAGWSYHKSAGKYIYGGMGSDAECGRECSLLPIGEVEFAVLPCHFLQTPEANEVVDEVLALAYDARLLSLPTLVPILRHGLAAIVNHFDYLNESLDPNSPFRSSILFRERRHVFRLREFLVAKQLFTSPYMNASGILSLFLILLLIYVS
jgi:hypothetical protein